MPILKYVMDLNRNIFILWLQGWDDAPEITKQCLASWEKLNPTWNIIKLSKDNLNDYMSVDDDIMHEIEVNPYLLKACQSNLIRTKLLSLHGGVWADSTTLCCLPLDEWLPKHLSNSFFCFPFVKPKEHAISNWFIAAKKNHLIMDEWLERSMQCVRNFQKKADPNNAVEYFWHHQLFDQMILENQTMHTTWKNLDAGIGKNVHAFTIGGNYTKKEIHSMLAEPTPLFKLSYRLYDAFKDESIVYLLSKVKELRYHPPIKL